MLSWLIAVPGTLLADNLLHNQSYCVNAAFLFVFYKNAFCSNKTKVIHLRTIISKNDEPVELFLVTLFKMKTWLQIHERVSAICCWYTPLDKISRPVLKTIFRAFYVENSFTTWIITKRSQPESISSFHQF